MQICRHEEVGSARRCSHVNRYKNNRTENVQSINSLRMKFYIFVIRKLKYKLFWSNAQVFKIKYTSNNAFYEMNQTYVRIKEHTRTKVSLLQNHCTRSFVGELGQIRI